MTESSNRQIDGGSIHKIMLEGRCSINGGADEACSAITLSLTRLTVLSQATVSFADEAMLSLPRIGLLKAIVSGTFQGGFDLTFDPATQSKLAQYIQFLDERGRSGDEARDYQRFVPIKKLVTIRRDGEPDSMARVIDLSRSGVAFTSSRTFAIGDDLTIGPYAARIVRVLEGGATAQFADLIAETDFDPMFDLDAGKR